MQDGDSTLLMLFYNGLIFFQFINSNVELFHHLESQKKVKEGMSIGYIKIRDTLETGIRAEFAVDTSVSVEDKYGVKTIIKKVHRDLKKNKSNKS